MRVKNVAVRTLTATWVTRRPSAITDSVTSAASRAMCSSISVRIVRSCSNVTSRLRDRGTCGSSTTGESSPPRPSILRYGPIVGPNCCASGRWSDLANSTTVWMPLSASRLRGAPADPRQGGDGPVAHRRDPRPPGQAGDAARLGEPGRRLRLQLRLADAHRARQPGLGDQSGLQLTGERLGVGGADPDDRFVPAPLLHRHRERPQRRHHPGRRGVVGRAVRRQEHRVRTLAGGRRNGIPDRTPNARASYEAVATTCRGRFGFPSPPTTTGRPASSGRRRISTAARN